MTTFRIKHAEENHQYGKSLTFKTTTVEADSFKVNDQGTVIFIDASGRALASFKTWVTIKPVEAPKPKQEGVTFTGTKVRTPVAGPYDHPYTAPYDR